MCCDFEFICILTDVNMLAASPVIVLVISVLLLLILDRCYKHVLENCPTFHSLRVSHFS